MLFLSEHLIPLGLMAEEGSLVSDDLSDLPFHFREGVEDAPEIGYLDGIDHQTGRGHLATVVCLLALLDALFPDQLARIQGQDLLLSLDSAAPL